MNRYLEARQERIDDIGAEVRSSIEASYGPGSDNPLFYHYLEHFDETSFWARPIGRELVRLGLLLPEEAQDLQLTMIGHDLIFNKNDSGYNELGSFERLRDIVNRPVNWMFFTESIDRLHQGTMSTVTTVEGGKLKQNYTPGDPFTEAVCSIDVGSLGRPYNYYITSAMRLAAENLDLSRSAEQQREDILSFFAGNVNLLRNHVYPLASARKMFSLASQNSIQLESDLRSRPDDLVNSTLALLSR